jgi:hypothetical protein
MGINSTIWKKSFLSCRTPNPSSPSTFKGLFFLFDFDLREVAVKVSLLALKEDMGLWEMTLFSGLFYLGRVSWLSPVPPWELGVLIFLEMTGEPNTLRGDVKGCLL